MENQAIDVLKSLGLSENESRVLYTILRLREADVRTISEYSGVPRTKAYEILRKLRDKGFVVELGTRPIRFSISDPSELLDRLIEEKEKEIKDLKRKVSILKGLLPALVERDVKKENYLMIVSSPEDFVSFLKDKIKGHTVVGYTRASKKYLMGIGDEEYNSPIDFVLAPDALYIPLNPLGEPRREYTIIVFLDPYIMEMVRLWVNEVLSNK